MTTRTGKRDAAARAWRRMFAVLMSSRPQRDAVLERLGLTPNDSKALHSLDAENGQPMRALAQLWRTDASNATWIVDRLERKGLAERRTPPRDRRVKLVFLTPHGLKTRNDILRAFHEPPPELSLLDRRDLDTLAAILARLPSTGDSP